MSGHHSLLGVELDGRYRIIRRIGSGGMGTVYEGIVRSTGTRVAVKVLSQEYAERPEAWARFRREARAASSVSHPCVVRTLDLGATAEGIHYLVMELLHGVPLSRVLAEGRLDLAAFAALLPKLLDGIAAAHASFVVHRDLKPDNVFLHLGEDGELAIKIVDFGISKVRTVESLQVTGTGQILGTPYYMAPEQARGAADVDHRADVYAAGAIAYELLAGMRPFGDIPAQQVLVAMLNERPRPLAEVSSETPRALVAWVDRAMAADPDERFPTAAAAATALRTTLERLVSTSEIDAARRSLHVRVDALLDDGEQRTTFLPASTPGTRRTGSGRLTPVTTGHIHGPSVARAAITAAALGAVASVVMLADPLRRALSSARLDDLSGRTGWAVASILLALVWMAVAALSGFARARSVAAPLSTIAHLSAVHQVYLVAATFAPWLAERPVARVLGAGASFLAIAFALRLALRFSGHDARAGASVRVVQALAAAAALLSVRAPAPTWIVALLFSASCAASLLLVRSAARQADVERRRRGFLLSGGIVLWAGVSLAHERQVLGVALHTPPLLAFLPIGMLTYGAIGPDLLAAGAEGFARAQGWMRRTTLGLIAAAVAAAAVVGGRLAGPVDLRLLLPPALTAGLFLLLAWQTLAVDHASTTTIATGVLLVLLGFLRLDFALLTVVEDPRAALWISRIDHFLWVFLPVVVVHLTRAMARFREQRWVVWAFWVSALATAPLALSDAYFTHVAKLRYGQVAQAAWAYLLYQPVVTAAALYGGVLLVSAARIATGARRQGLVSVLVGYVSATVLLLLGEGRSVLGVDAYPYGNFAVISCALVMYGILRAEIADARMLLRTTIAHGVASALLLVVVATATVGVVEATRGAGTFVAVVSAALVTAVALQPSARFVQGVLDRRLSSDSFDEAAALKALGEATSGATRNTDVADAVRRIAEQVFEPTSAAVLLPTGDGGFARGPFLVDPDAPALLEMRRTVDVVRCGASTLAVPAGLPGFPNGTLLVPLAWRGRVIAVLALAPSARRPLATRRARLFLRAFADHAAVVLDNASLHAHVDAQIARRTSELGDLVVKLEAKLSAHRGDEARARMLKELRLKVEELARENAGDRRDLDAALDLLQGLLDEDPVRSMRTDMRGEPASPETRS